MHKINILLRKLEELQEEIETNTCSGVFSSTRKHIYINYKREDNNLFFTSLILIILDHLSLSLKDDGLLNMINKIKEKAWQSFDLYKNKAGGITYNFWKEHPKEDFPNSKYIFNHKHFHIPDDLDDTALAFIAKPHSIEEVYGLKRRAEVHINTFRKKVKNTFSSLKQIKTYTTWSGDKMYYEFDVCVLCNILCCFRHYNLPKDLYYYEAVQLIEITLENQYHLKYPYETSHHYANTTMILYHLSKLCEYDEEFRLKWSKKIRNDLLKVLPYKKYSIGKVILANSLMKLGYNAPNIQLEGCTSEFPYFIIGFLTPYENILARTLAKNKWSWLVYNCEAYSLALKLEYLKLKNQILERT